MSLRAGHFVVAALFVGAVLGAGAFQTGLKAWPQVVVLVVAASALLSYFTGRSQAFNRSWTTLFAIAVLEALLTCGEALHQWILPNDGVIIVDGVERRVMSYTWIWPMLAAFALTPCIVWGYRRYARRETKLELAFAIALFVVWAVLFVRYEI